MNSCSPWVQTTSGIAFDLLCPTPEMVNFKLDVAPALARLARFNGHIGSGPYSVAQHSVLGADALFAETGSKRLAGLFLLHDAHEAYIGDMATPVKWALGQMSEEAPRGAPGSVVAWLRVLTARVDEAILFAAGFRVKNAEFMDDAERTAIKTMDRRMLITERNQLLGPPPRPWAPVFERAEPVRIKGKITVWPWPDAADEFMARAERWLPVFQKNRKAA